MIAFGGDETGAIVGDVGRFYSKFGFAGEDTPKCVLNSQLGVISEGEAEQQTASNSFEIPDLTQAKSYELPKDYPNDIGKFVSPYSPPSTRSYVSPICDGCWNAPASSVGPIDDDGQLHDWDLVEHLWEIALSRLKTGACHHPVLCAMPSWTKPEAQERYLELIFEQLDAPAAFLSRSASLAAFASGRASALVVDCGAASSSATPVVDGYVLLRATKRSPMGGDRLNQHLLKLLPSNLPRCLARADRLGMPRPVLNDNMMRLAQLELAREVKETLRMDAASTSQCIELPDGTTLDAATFAPVPELLFQPDTGLPSLVRNALQDADCDVRKDLLQSLVVTGAGSLFPGLPDRLHHHLNADLASTFKSKLIVPSNLERAFAVWIGGSVLASLGSFQQQWLSRAEFFDDGPLAAQERWN